MHTEVIESHTRKEAGLRGRWRARGAPDAAVAGPGASRDLLARLLDARGLHAPEDVALFLDPALTRLHDPSLLPGLERAAERLVEAARGGERIFIYGDYDADGITATAILFHMLRAIAPGADVRAFVPHRNEGYGLSAEALRELADAGARVVVSVDCGVTAVEQAAEARRLGLDLIITDHHEPRADGALPECYALVHPRIDGSRYPFGMLCGAGVAFKLAWRLATLAVGSERVGPELRALLLELLGLAALGAIADVVPLIGENRVIVKHGLTRVRSTGLEGLKRLVEAGGLADERIDSAHVAFRLAPRLNAAGRIGHAKEAVRLLTTATGDEALQIATTLSQQNEERRKIERRIAKEAAGLAEDAGMTSPERRAIVLAREGWEAGVVGIVCSRLVEKFHRPALLLRQEGEVCRGSGRSVNGFNLHAALEACSGHLAKFGGHEAAAGLTIETGRVEAFAEAFIEHVNDRLPAEDLVPFIDVDTHASLDELTGETVEKLEGLAPFGQGNPEPSLVVRRAVVANWPEAFGREGAHARMVVRSADGRANMRLIGWRWAEDLVEMPPGTTIDAVVKPRINRWNGWSTVEPELVDLRVV